MYATFNIITFQIPISTVKAHLNRITSLRTVPSRVQIESSQTKRASHWNMVVGSCHANARIHTARNGYSNLILVVWHTPAPDPSVCQRKRNVGYFFLSATASEHKHIKWCKRTRGIAAAVQMAQIYLRKPLSIGLNILHSIFVVYCSRFGCVYWIISHRIHTVGIEYRNEPPALSHTHTQQEASSSTHPCCATANISPAFPTSQRPDSDDIKAESQRCADTISIEGYVKAKWVYTHIIVCECVRIK